jgi:hypothetical protein
MLNRIAAALRHWRRPRYQHTQLAKARADCNREIVGFIRAFEQLRREMNAHHNVANLRNIQRTVAAPRQTFCERRRSG